MASRTHQDSLRPEDVATELLARAKDETKQQAKAALYYSKVEAEKYSSNSNERIQFELTSHALWCLQLDQPPNLLLDIGSGSGFSLSCLNQLLPNTAVIGYDVSPGMVEVAVANDKTRHNNMLLANAAYEMPFRDECFDAAVSVSAVQWLCSCAEDEARGNLSRFFASLRRCLTRDGKAVLQVYPDTNQQAQMLKEFAKAAGFVVHFVVDFPHKGAARKWFLCLDKKDHRVMSKPVLKLLCPLGERFNENCALSRWEKAPTSFPEDIRALKHERLAKEHIIMSHHIYRRSRHAERMKIRAKTEKLHPKALQSSELLEFEVIAARCMSFLYGEDISLEQLSEKSSAVPMLIHAIYSSIPAHRRQCRMKHTASNLSTSVRNSQYKSKRQKLRPS